MASKQQQETKQYFGKNASGWVPDKRRDDYVLKVISKREKTENFLDIGCGTGELVRAVAKKGIRSYGVDFSENMIKIAKENAETEGINAEFIKSHFFDFDFSEYDVISANGIIEYLSPKELNIFFDKVGKELKEGRSFVFSSRNRLFNIFSVNKFTEEELNKGNVNCLLNEAVKIVNSENVIDKLLKCKTLSLSAKRKQINTGIDVSVRYQYTPAQLIKELHKRDLRTLEVFPVHIHGVTPKFKDKYPNIHKSILEIIRAGSKDEDQKDLIPYASTFMIHAMKI